MGGSDSRIRGVLRVGMGQPAKNSPHVLHQLRLIPRRLLPDGDLQRTRVLGHRRQPRPALHLVGRAPEAAPSHPLHGRLAQNDRQQCPLRPQVQTGRPGAGPDRRGASRQGKRKLRPWRMVCWRTPVHGDRRSHATPARARGRAARCAHGRDRPIEEVYSEPV